MKVEIYNAVNVDVLSRIAPNLFFLILSLLDPIFSSMSSCFDCFSPLKMSLSFGFSESSFQRQGQPLEFFPSSLFIDVLYLIIFILCLIPFSDSSRRIDP